MSNLNIVRAWKDEDYRNSLNAEQLALLPTNPVGLMELAEAELDTVVGGLALASDKTKSSGEGTLCICSGKTKSKRGATCFCHIE